MTGRYRTIPEVKFKGFRELESRRIKASDTVWAVLVGSKVAQQALADAPDQRLLLADAYPTLPHVQRMNQRLDRARVLLEDAEGDLCTMALNFTFALHEDFLRSCLRFLIPLGKITADTIETINSVSLHEKFAKVTRHPVDADSLKLFHLTRRIRNAHTHAAGLVRDDLVDFYAALTPAQRNLWETLTSEPLVIPSVGDSAAVGVQGLIASLAIQKRLAYDVNIGLQRAIPRAIWADIAAAEYFSQSPKSPKDPSALRSLRGYLRGGFTALALTEGELAAAISRRK